LLVAALCAVPCVCASRTPAPFRGGSFYRIGPAWLAVYLLYILFLEIMLMKNSCVNCYYFGKLCAFGKGKLASILFRKGDNGAFCSRQITWKNIFPDFLVSLIPLFAGVCLLALNSSLLLLFLVILLLILTSAGNGLVRGSLACNHCRQRELGCPAQKLINKTGGNLH